MNCILELTEDGIELLFHTNHLGHFQLYNLLEGLIEKTAKEVGSATVVHVSSSAHYQSEVPFVESLEVLNNSTSYKGFPRYGEHRHHHFVFSLLLRHHI